MSTGITDRGLKTRNSIKNKTYKSDGSLRLTITEGESVICHLPEDPFNNLEMTLVSTGRHNATLTFTGDMEVWRSLIFRKRLEDMLTK